MQTAENEFLNALRASNKGMARNAAISLEEAYIKWLDSAATQTGTTRSRVVKQLIEEKLGNFSPLSTATKTTVTLHPAIAEAVKRAGGDINTLINQALAQALEMEISA